MFVCECNLNRSPTFERYFKEHYPQFEVKSCGTLYGYPERLTDSILAWADIVFAMERKQENVIRYRFPQHYKKVVVVGVPDVYDPDQKELLDFIKEWSEQYFKNKGD